MSIKRITPAPRVERTCEHCESTFFVNESVIKWGHGRYCSRRCAGLAQWRGKPSPTGMGYIQVKPAPGTQNVLQHRLIMEQHLGRPLAPGEEVHHINGDGMDNRIENLRLVNRSEHMKIHAAERGMGWSYKYARCVECGTTEYRHNAKGLCISCYMHRYRTSK